MGLYQQNKIDVPPYQAIDEDYVYRKKMHDDSLALHNLNREWNKTLLKYIREEESAFPGSDKKVEDIINNVYDSRNTRQYNDTVNISNTETIEFQPYDASISPNNINNSIAAVTFLRYLNKITSGNEQSFGSNLYLKPIQKILKPHDNINKLKFKSVDQIPTTKPSMIAKSKYQQRWGNKRQPGMNAITRNRHTIVDGSYIEDLNWVEGEGNVNRDELRILEYLYSKANK